ncbi:MAG: hypothetical protein WKF97_21895 [Chitinophagaceae bacterium]
MNDTFNIKRFGWLFKKTLLERPVQLFGLVGLSLIISLLIYAAFKDLVGYDEAQNLSFICGLVGGGVFLSSIVFNYFSSTASGSSYLTLPASHFEKWLCGVIITGIIFTFLFLVFYHIIDATFVLLYHNSLDVKNPYYKEMYESVHSFSLDGFIAGKTYIMYLNATGAMLIGSLYFNKASFIKVALIVCALYIGGHLLNYFIAKAVFDNIDKALPYYCVFIPVGKEFGKVLLPGYASVAVDISLLYIVPAILWLVTYVRLREKEF